MRNLGRQDAAAEWQGELAAAKAREATLLLDLKAADERRVQRPPRRSRSLIALLRQLLSRS